MKLNSQSLVMVLRDMANLIEKNDSFEGQINYTCLDDDCEVGQFEVKAFYRTGNSMGQGGSSIIQ